MTVDDDERERGRRESTNKTSFMQVEKFDLHCELFVSNSVFCNGKRLQHHGVDFIQPLLVNERGNRAKMIDGDKDKAICNHKSMSLKLLAWQTNAIIIIKECESRGSAAPLLRAPW
ncbi:hypothetical protein ACOME3_001790 [Neoechinorhynchus agilis]